MERLTEKAWQNLDPWECCGQDSYCKRSCHEKGGCTHGCIVPKLYAKLAKYEDLEEQGLLLRLPCKVGDTVYVPTRNIVSEFTVCSIEVYNEGIFVNWRCENGIYPCARYANIKGFAMTEIGKTVFFTKSEAEQLVKGEK